MKRRILLLTIFTILLGGYLATLFLLFPDYVENIFFMIPPIIFGLLIAFVLGNILFTKRKTEENKKLVKEFKIEKELYTSLAKNNEVVTNELPIGLIIYDNDLIIRYANEYAKNIFDNDLLGKNITYVSFTLEDAIKNNKNQIEIIIYNNIYKIMINHKYNSVYLFDVTKESRAINIYDATRPAIMILSIDNLENSLENKELKDRTEILGKYYSAIEAWKKDYNIYGETNPNNKQTFIVNRMELGNIMDGHFSIINIINDISLQYETDISVSIGIGTESENYIILAQYAEKALENALDRGGSQAIVYDGNTYKAYGAKSNKGTRKIPRTITKASADMINKHIVESSAVIIMPHIDTDADALGAALGILQLCEALETPAKILLNLDRVDQTTSKVIAASNTEYIKLRQSIITEAELPSFFVGKTLLIIVDHSDMELSPSKKVYQMAGTVDVIDHHRKNMKENINIKLDYIDTNASSSVEIITEMLDLLPIDIVIPPFVATTMLLGMAIDTNNFASHVSSKTFDSASYLMSYDADSFKVKMFLRESLPEQMKRIKLLENAQMIDGKYAVVIDDEVKTTKANLARTAEALLNIDNIVAGFAIGRLEDGVVGISGRSNGTFNIHSEMEKFGGGGHFNIGAAQIKDGRTPSQVYENLILNLKDTTKGENNQMKVILVADVKKQGKKGDIIECTPGYANFLMTKKLAIEANPQNLAVLEDEKQSQEKSKQQELEVAQKLKEIIDKTTVTIRVKTGENGKFFGSISNKQVSEALMTQYNIDVDKRKINLPHDKIEALGSFECTIKLHKDVTAILKLDVKEGD